MHCANSATSLRLTICAGVSPARASATKESSGRAAIGFGRDTVNRLVLHSVFMVVFPWSEKKTDVSEHPKALEHVGLLVNGPPGTAELPLI